MSLGENPGNLSIFKEKKKMLGANTKKSLHKQI